MSNQIPTGFSEEFTQEVQLKLQQRGSRFAEAATRRSFTGKDAKAVEQLGSVVAQKKTTRHADTPLMDTPHDARWVYPVDYEFADLIDPQDELRAIASFEDRRRRGHHALLEHVLDRDGYGTSRRFGLGWYDGGEATSGKESPLGSGSRSRLRPSLLRHLGRRARRPAW